MSECGGKARTPVVLVVDDEEPLRLFIHTVLRGSGFRVVTAGSGNRALEIVKRLRRPIHALVSDVQMPDMSGFDLAYNISRLKPGLPVLLMSGTFAADDDGVERQWGSRVRFLKKPFTPEALISRMREVLRSSSAGMPGAVNGSDLAGMCGVEPVRPAGAESRYAPADTAVSLPQPVLVRTPSKAGFDRYEVQVREVKDYAMFMIDEHGILTSWNAGVENLLGYTEGEWIGQHASMIFTPDGQARELFEAEIQLARTAGTAADVGWHRRKDGTKLFASGILNVVRDDQGSVLGYVKIMSDDTVRHMLQERLTESNLSLEQFAHVASHELQEPLRTMTAFSQLLESTYRGKLGGDAEQFLGYIVSAASNMSKLVADLLTFARVGGEKPHAASMALEEGLHNALAELSQAIRESGSAITHDPLPTVQADGRLMVRLFRNLVGNAIKYRKPADRVTVQIRAERRDAHWIIAVQDNGIGFDPQYADRIFTPFNRLNAESEYPGTGLGLAICRRIVEAHGGRIWAESKPGEGSTFRFSLPAEARTLRTLIPVVSRSPK